MLNALIDESGIEAANDAMIAGDRGAQANFDVINQSLDTLDRLIRGGAWTTEAELTVLRLGVRIFNAAGAGLKTARAGYYQPAFSQVRDILETSYLLDYFKQDPGQIAIWISSKAAYKL